MRTPARKRMAKDSARSERAAGSTLTEALVVLVILSLSMLAAGKALGTGINALHDTLQEQRATALSADIAELLHGLQPGSGMLSATTDATPACTGAAACSADEFVTAAVGQWQARVRSGLHNGPAELEISNEPLPNTLRIRLHWRQSGGRLATRTTFVAMADPS
jgi:Tfp pilus assembly protein PilV